MNLQLAKHKLTDKLQLIEAYVKVGGVDHNSSRIMTLLGEVQEIVAALPVPAEEEHF